jgi:hypothetical protein
MLIEGLCSENRRPTPFEKSASAVKYLRLPTALRSKPAYRTPCSSRLSAKRGMNLLASVVAKAVEMLERLAAYKRGR